LPAGRRRYKTVDGKRFDWSAGAKLNIFSENCGLHFGGFGDGVARRFRSAAAKEKRRMPCAALATTKQHQEQEKQDGPLQNAAPVRAQNIFTSAKVTSPSA